jgi:hypothetical protein
MKVVLEFCYIVKPLHAEMCSKTVFYSSLFSCEVKLNFRNDENVELELLRDGRETLNSLALFNSNGLESCLNTCLINTFVMFVLLLSSN